MRTSITWATDLMWLPLAGGSHRGRRAELKKAARLFAARQVVQLDNPPQAGFARTAFSRGAVSLAAAVRETLAGRGITRFVAALPLEGQRHALVAASEGCLLPTAGSISGDVSGSLEETKRRFEALVANLPDAARFAPANWGIKDSCELSVSELTPGASCRLRNLKKLPWWVFTPLLLGAILGLGLCLVDKKPAAAPAVRQPTPWKEKPSALTFALACSRALDGAGPLFVAGYAFKGAVCTPAGVSLGWQKSAPAADIASVHPDVFISPDGKTATLKRPLEKLAGFNEEVLDEPAAKRALLNAAARKKLSLTLMKPRGKMTPFVLTGLARRPEAVLEDLAVPGVRLTAIEYPFEAGLINWRITGELYAR